MLVKLSLGKWSCCMPLFLCTNDKAQTADSTREVCMCVCVCWIHMHTAVMRKTWHLLNHTSSKKTIVNINIKAPAMRSKDLGVSSVLHK